MKNAGEIVFIDVIHPLWMQAILLVGIAFLLLAPILVFAAARNGRPWGRALAYLAGVILVMGALMAIEWGYPNPETFSHRFSVLFRHLGMEVVAYGAVLCGLAVGLGTMLRRKAPAR